MDTPTPDQIAQVEISAHLRGDRVLEIDWFCVPRALRRQGVGSAAYEAFVRTLPPTVEYVEIFAADTEGTGNADPFWEALGFDYKYEDDNEGEYLGYEEQHTMWQGVNGHPTPPRIVVTQDDDE